MSDKNCSDDRETSLYLTQIQHLDKRLERCQLKCDELQKQNKELVLLHMALEDQEDCEFLNHFKAEKQKEVDELAVKLETQQEVAELTLKQLKLQQNLELQELQEQVEKLNSQIREQAAQCEERRLQEKLLKQKLLDLGFLEEKLLREEEQQETIVQNLKEDLENEIDSACAEKQQTLEKWSEVKVSEIVQEEAAQLREEEQQLQVVLYEIQDRQEGKSTLEAKESELSVELEQQEAAAAAMEQKMVQIQKETEELTEMSEQLTMRVENCVRVYQSIVAQIDQLSRRLDSEKEEYLHKTNMAAQLEEELKEESTRRAVLEDDMMKAVIVLRHVLEASGEAMGSQLSQDLLRILERNLPEGEDSTLRDSILRESIETRSGAQKPASDDEPERAETLDLATDPLFLLARFRPGDFGFIPRPTWKVRSSADPRSDLLI